jgi:hypothetical protein
MLLQPRNPANRTHRYLSTAVTDAKFSRKDAARLKAARIEVNQFWMDIGRDELEALADELLRSAADVVP